METGKSRSPLWVAPLVLPFTYFIFQASVEYLGKTYGYLVGFLFYWAFCVIFSLFFLDKKRLKEIYKQKNSRSAHWWSLLALIPAVGTLFVAFIPSIPTFTPFAFLILLIVAICNGLAEELFWRGVFIATFKTDKIRAFLYPALFFGLWHISLASVEEIQYHGGPTALVGGAFILGAIWGWVAYKQQSIFMTTLSHVLVNFFAFSGLIADNWLH